MTQSLENGISPWVVGQTHPTWELTWTSRLPGNIDLAVDLTGATVTLWIFRSGGATLQGQGSISVPSPITGVVYYTPAAADSATPGAFWVALKAVYPDSSVLWQMPAVKWVVTQLP